MCWRLVFCLLLASAVLARPRPKRSLGYIKSVILSKLFGPRATTVVIAHPVAVQPTAEIESYQLYKIPGFDDILLKVFKKPQHMLKDNRNPEEKDENKEEIEETPVKFKDSVIVKPEVAIIGSYLGTSTEKETLIAIQVVKNLLKSGILNGGRDNWIQEVAVPMISQSPQLEYIGIKQNVPKEPLQIHAEKQGHFFVPSMDSHIKQVNVSNRNAMPLYPVGYPPLFVAPEVEFRPVQSKYSYKQKGNTADMTYESYNNKDVLVTRTEKESPVPQFLKLRIADVATIGANPYLVQQPVRMSVSAPLPVPYSYFSPDTVKIVPEKVQSSHIGSYHPIRTLGAIQGSEYIATKTIDTSYVPNMQQIILCREQSMNQKCPYENIKVKNKVLPSKQNGSETLNHTISINILNEGNKDKNNQAAIEFLKNQSVNGQLVSQYFYKQMNHESDVIDLGENLHLSEGSKHRSNVNVPKDFVFIPPNNVNIPPPVSLRFKDNNESIGNVGKEEGSNQNVNAFASKLITYNNIKDADFKHNPIIVADAVKLLNAKTNTVEAKEVSDVNRRGDIPGSMF